MAVTDKIKRTVYFDPVEWGLLIIAAAHYGTSASDIVRVAVRDWMERERKNDDGAFNDY